MLNLLGNLSSRLVKKKENHMGNASTMAAEGIQLAEDGVQTWDKLTMLSGKVQTLDSEVDQNTAVLMGHIEKLKSSDEAVQKQALKDIYALVEKAWRTPGYGRDLAYSLCDTIRLYGVLDYLLEHCMSSSTNKELAYECAHLLEQILTPNNRDRVVKSGFEAVVKLACSQDDTDLVRIGTGLLENMFKHSADTCTKVIQLGGLNAIIRNCRENDKWTLRHCAAALANCAMYGGVTNHVAMVDHKAPEWLFPLAFSDDEFVRYYACLSICVLAANREVERAVTDSDTLSLVEPFVTSHDPEEFARSDWTHAQGRSDDWLERLIPLLQSSQEEAQCLATFHFAMEAGIKKAQERIKVFYEIGAVRPLIRVASSSSNPTAIRFAVQALTIIGEEIPSKLNLSVPTWSTDDVLTWLKQIGFGGFRDAFKDSQVDGDLLLLLTDDQLRDDIRMSNSLIRKRFLRELVELKTNADYSSCDSTKLRRWLRRVGPEYMQYTYHMVHCGIDRTTLEWLTEDHLLEDCGIANGVHRMKIQNAIKAGSRLFPLSSETSSPSKESIAPKLDVFISYRRATGSQLASLLKVHLQLRGFNVFIDVEKLEAGKFDNKLLENVKKAKNFILVLTPNALDRCLTDTEGKDWVRKEIVAAIESSCNIVPVMSSFYWPKPEDLPEDMRAVCYFNGIKWIHDYQDACIDKLERFLRGEDMSKRGRLSKMSSKDEEVFDTPRYRLHRMGSSDSI
ncbi:PREDICTED: sterile alpha and TIR motif-containing protein 1-like isoform X1 [Branchiostoma belcheri]|uniref:NAD(+) hydrolase SARM1 n=1 Tax=Branchiostoma belcheri TaxID=7741 RepID=A0A6P4YFJ5_BRABE|nr:PREDICTED: sterile alpha and TIR motif-containing protein 1-like isoform X1 [Branchiostoma belcheri]